MYQNVFLGFYENFTQISIFQILLVVLKKFGFETNDHDKFGHHSSYFQE